MPLDRLVAEDLLHGDHANRKDQPRHGIGLPGAGNGGAHIAQRVYPEGERIGVEGNRQPQAGSENEEHQKEQPADCAAI